MKPNLLLLLFCTSVSTAAFADTPPRCKISPEDAIKLAQLDCTSAPLQREAQFWSPNYYLIAPAGEAPSFLCRVNCVTGVVLRDEADIGAGAS